MSGDEVARTLGVVNRRHLVGCAAAIARGDAAGALEAVAEVFEAGYDMIDFCHALLQTLRDLVVLAVCPEPGRLLELSPGECEELRPLLERLSLERLYQLFGILAAREREISLSPLPRNALEMTVVRLAGLPDLAPVGELTARLEALETGVKGAAAGAKTPAPPRREERRTAGRPSGAAPPQRRAPRCPGAAISAAPGPRDAPGYAPRDARRRLRAAGRGGRWGGAAKGRERADGTARGGEDAGP